MIIKMKVAVGAAGGRRERERGGGCVLGVSCRGTRLLAWVALPLSCLCETGVG